MDNNGIQKVYIDLIHYPLKVLGPDVRVGVWFQGCTLGCKECISQHTWEQTEDKLYDINDIGEKLSSFQCRKLTISGGEAFQQPEALYNLLIMIKEDFDDILVYSGYTYEYLKNHFPKILSLIDVLIDGVFMNNLPTNRRYKGSSNQKMYIFNANKLASYELFSKETDRIMQLHEKEDQVYLLGIPDINDTKKIQQILNGE